LRWQQICSLTVASTTKYGYKKALCQAFSQKERHATLICFIERLDNWQPRRVHFVADATNEYTTVAPATNNLQPGCEKETTMPDISEQTTIEVETLNIASAPGDLPVPAIAERLLALRHQFRHDNTIVPLAPRPGQEVEVLAVSGEALPLERAALFYTTDGSQPESNAAVIPMERHHMSWDVQAGYLTYWRALIPAQPTPGIVRYRIGGWTHGTASSETPDVWAQDGQGYAFRRTGTQATTTFAFTVEEASLPAWVQNAVIYHIFLDRFRTSKPDGSFDENDDPQALHGGTLRGVTEALPYLQELGITCLWLSPLHPAETYHRYDVLDYFDVDPRLGSKEDLKELVERAHALGMRVMLDYVPSHTSWHHPAFLAAQQQRDAETYDWYTFEQWPDQYRSFLDLVPTLPSLRSDSKGARQHIIESALYWMREFGIDGFRLDHAIGHSMDYWTDLRHATHATSPDAFLLGEATDTPETLRNYRGKLDGILDFPLTSALRHTFALQDWSVHQFEQFLFAYEHFMADGPGRATFLDNHDMNRFLFLAGNSIERLKMAALCQFTLAGTPILYYGTEIGLTQRAAIEQVGDAEARRNMPWKRDEWNLDLLAFYQALIQIRRTTPILAHGKRRLLHLSDACYAYLRSGEEQPAEGDVLTVFNLSDSPREIPVPIAQLRCLLATAETPKLHCDGQETRITLAPQSAAAFQVAR